MSLPEVRFVPMTRESLTVQFHFIIFLLHVLKAAGSEQQSDEAELDSIQCRQSFGGRVTLLLQTHDWWVCSCFILIFRNITFSAS